MDRHLEIELLSALADGELDLSAMRDAKTHLAGCDACTRQLSAFRRLDDVLLTPTRLSCDGARELRSALLDGELSAEEAEVAVTHLAECGDCREEQAAWASVDANIKTLTQYAPSARTDARIARLTAPQTKPRLPLIGPTALRPLALRGAVAASLVAAILIGLLPTGVVPEQANVPDANTAVVAGVQQLVLYSPTNTLYVLQTAASAVDAVDASTLALRTRIAVGGKPTALALSASSILVLDPTEKSLTEIDATSNTIVGSTQIPVAGTPTSLQVDPNSGRIIIAAVADPATGGAVATPLVTTVDSSSGGVVAVIDPSTKKVETVSQVDVAPKLVVTDASGKQTLLVATNATTVVGPTLKKIKTLPGGVAAAFASGRDLIAILARDGAGSILFLSGDGAGAPVRLVGAPLAVTAVADVGFAVLLGSGNGGRIVIVDESGKPVGASEVSAIGKDLTYDPASRRFTVVGTNILITSPLPAGVLAAASSSPSPVVAHPSIAPETSAAPQASPSPSASASPAASPSASPSTTPVASPSAVALAPSLPPGLPKGTTILGGDLYHVNAGGRVPTLVAATPLRVWFLDSTNHLNALNVSTGEVFEIASLPRDAEIASLAVGADAVYAADGRNARLWSLDLKTELLSSRPLPYIDAQTTMAVAGDGRIWFASGDQSQIVSYDPRGGRVELIDATANGVSALVIDAFGRVWSTDGDRQLTRFDPATGRLERYRLHSKGAARVLLPDPSGSIWVGTTAGEVISVRDGVQLTPLVAARPIAALALDSKGVTWYLTPGASGQGGFTMGRVLGQAQQVAIPGAATSLWFSLGGRTWLADPAGGFFVFTGAPR